MESQTACWWGPLEARVGCLHVPALHVGWCHRSCTRPEPGLHPQLPCSETTQQQQQQQRVEGICYMSHAPLMDTSQHATNPPCEIITVSSQRQGAAGSGAHLGSVNSMKAKGGGRGGILMSIAWMSPNCATENNYCVGKSQRWQVGPDFPEQQARHTLSNRSCSSRSLMSLGKLPT